MLDLIYAEILVDVKWNIFLRHAHPCAVYEGSNIILNYWLLVPIINKSLSDLWKIYFWERSDLHEICS